jgi:hypothetical protein
MGRRFRRRWKKILRLPGKGLKKAFRHPKKLFNNAVHLPLDCIEFIVNGAVDLVSMTGKAIGKGMKQNPNVCIGVGLTTAGALVAYYASQQSGRDGGTDLVPYGRYPDEGLRRYDEFCAEFLQREDNFPTVRRKPSCDEAWWEDYPYDTMTNGGPASTDSLVSGPTGHAAPINPLDIALGVGGLVTAAGVFVGRKAILRGASLTWKAISTKMGRGSLGKTTSGQVASSKAVTKPLGSKAVTKGGRLGSGDTTALQREFTSVMKSSDSRYYRCLERGPGGRKMHPGRIRYKSFDYGRSLGSPHYQGRARSVKRRRR